MNRNERSIKVIQFGEGNFLRGFVDWMIAKMNDEDVFNGSVAVVQPLANGLLSKLEEQDYAYTHILKGLVGGVARKEHYKNDSIVMGINPYENFEEYLKLAEIESAKIIVSNTTEAGIVFDAKDQFDNDANVTYPGKLTRLLYKRFEYVKGSFEGGYTLLPCELIDKNADCLRKAVLQYVDLWRLGDDFREWVINANTFCNTLVDRIVPGYPKDTIEQVWEEIGYEDHLVVESEQFNLWVIQGDDQVRNLFPADSVGCNVLFVDDVTPYKTRKVRILNGAHTSLVPIGLLYGLETVKESMDDKVVRGFLDRTLSEEIIPTLPLKEDALTSYAAEVIERFENPFVKHYLMSISLNSMSKYRTRVLPSVLTFIDKEGRLPNNLVTSLAAYIVMYRGSYNGVTFELKDDSDILGLYKKLWTSVDGGDISIEDLVREILGMNNHWGRNLNEIKGFTSMVVDRVSSILNGDLESII